MLMHAAKDPIAVDALDPAPMCMDGTVQMLYQWLQVVCLLQVAHLG